jgi:spore coat protein U-like protein
MPAGFTTAGTTTAGGAQANVDLDIAIGVLGTPDGKVLAGGTYTDTITVTLTPAT